MESKVANYLFVVEGGEYRDTLDILGIFTSEEEANKVRDTLTSINKAYICNVIVVPVFDTSSSWMNYTAEEVQKRRDDKKAKDILKSIK